MLLLEYPAFAIETQLNPVFKKYQWNLPLAHQVPVPLGSSWPFWWLLPLLLTAPRYPCLRSKFSVLPFFCLNISARSCCERDERGRRLPVPQVRRRGLPARRRRRRTDAAAQARGGRPHLRRHPRRRHQLWRHVEVLHRRLPRHQGRPRAGPRHVATLHRLRLHVAHLGEVQPSVRNEEESLLKYFR